MTGTLPVLDLDGRRIVDSTAIIDALEARQPEPALYPADPDERRRALELEEFFDEHAGHDMRRVGFWEGRDQPGPDVRLSRHRPRGGGSGAADGRCFPVAWRYVVKRYGFDQDSFERSKVAVVGALDRIESERAGGDYLVGEGFTVADLTAAALLYPLVWPPEFQYELPECPGRRPSSPSATIRPSGGSRRLGGDTAAIPPRPSRKFGNSSALFHARTENRG